ncbi:hypothetical protein C5167_027646 [Papaver somniferum]|uniref:oxysterol-binding protein-related protein 3C-like n=1 Tax=Papaver somniferum TaxID=3469 RepID=UPI000E705EB5|nr:oxysterol-binding protein-related protein 3C-like [Papaver somniferum]RZC91583.1 hypothetical protein C5167_027646 [Papaver somniferum]
MASKRGNGGGLLSSIKSSLWKSGKIPMNESTNSHGGVEFVSPEGDPANAAVEATKQRWKPKERQGWWNTAKKYIGMDVMYLSILPIALLEPRSQLQRVAESMEYSNFLDRANECEDPYMQLVYASTWSLSFFYALRRTFKAFNPILGETYEMVNHDGITYIGEQVSHHPPIDVVHAENEHFVLDSTNCIRTRLLGNSLDIYPGTIMRITLKRNGVVLEGTPPNAKAYNLIFGRMWITICGETTITNLTTGDYVVLKFQPSGWFSGARFDVDGYVYNAAKEPKIFMTGKWTKSMSYQPCDKKGKPLPGTELKEIWRVPDVPVKDKYHFTYFSHKVNSFDTAPRQMLASDSRLRPDRYALEKGDLSKVSHQKNRLEVRQRKERKRREANIDKYTPKWFDLTGEAVITPYGDTQVYKYNGKYDEHRETVNSLNISADEVDGQPTEFDPWQYGQEKLA